MFLQNIAAGAVAGAGWSFVGYGEKRVKEAEKFSFSKLLETMLIGAVLGAIGHSLGLNPQDFRAWTTQAAIMGGVVPFAKKAWNAIKVAYQYVKTW